MPLLGGTKEEQARARSRFIREIEAQLFAPPPRWELQIRRANQGLVSPRRSDVVAPLVKREETATESLETRPCESLFRLAELYAERAFAMGQEGNLDAAEDGVRRAIDVYRWKIALHCPDDSERADLLYHYALIAESIGAYQEAKISYRRAFYGGYDGPLLPYLQFGLGKALAHQAALEVTNVKMFREAGGLLQEAHRESAGKPISCLALAYLVDVYKGLSLPEHAEMARTLARTCATALHDEPGVLGLERELGKHLVQGSAESPSPEHKGTHR